MLISKKAIDLGASRRVSRGIMQALEMNRLKPGQRLVETTLAAEYRVGRNAVREAVQWLAAHGVIEISRHRSASLRRLEPAEALDVLEVAEAVVGLMGKAAARHFKALEHESELAAALAEVEKADDASSSGAFARARRHVYQLLLRIGGNHELQLLFPAVGLHIFFAQFRTAMSKQQCLDDFRALTTAVRNQDVEHAQALGRAHIGRLRGAIQGRGD